MMPISKAKTLSFIALIAMVLGSVGLDQISKSVAEKNLMVWSSAQSLKEYQGRSVPVASVGMNSPIDRSKFYLDFNFTYVRNQGAAWGLFSNLSDHIRIPFFYLVTCIAFIVIFMYLRATPHSHRLVRFALMLILSGAIGNFTDRLAHGYVIDFIDFNWNIPLPFPIRWDITIFPEFLNLLNMSLDIESWQYDFPKFNWADSMISFGVFLLMCDMFFLEPARNKELVSA